MGHEALVSRIDDGLQDGWVVQLLRFIDFVAAWNTTGVIVGEIGGLFANRRDHIPFHDLHVVNVIEEFERVRTNLFAKSHPQADLSHM